MSGGMLKRILLVLEHLLPLDSLVEMQHSPFWCAQVIGGWIMCMALWGGQRGRKGKSKARRETDAGRKGGSGERG